MLWLVISYALIDSVDPCIYVVFTSTLTSAVLVNPKYAVRVGAAFIVSLYVGYVLFGALLRYVVVRLPLEVLVVFLFAYALVVLLHTTLTGKREFSEELVCRENDVPCKIASTLKLNVLANKGVPAALALGLISAFTLLPCSAGLYIAYNTVMRNYGFLAWLFLTLLYVAVFISPLILLFTVVVSASKLRTVHNILRYERPIKVVGALLMLLTAVYLLLSYKGV